MKGAKQDYQVDEGTCVIKGGDGEKVASVAGQRDSATAGGVVDGDFKKLLSAIYLVLIAAGFLFWVPTLNSLLPLAAVVLLYIAHTKRATVMGTWMESHLSWCMGTFVWSLIWGVILMVVVMGGALGLVGAADHLNADQGMAAAGLGGMLLITAGTVVCFWYIYRVVKGVIRYKKGQPIG